MEKLRASEVRSWLFGAVIFCFLLASWEVVLRSQQRPEAPPIHIEVKQVLVPVIVTDRKGRYIGNLTAQDFRVFDDGVEQKIVAFSGNAGAASNYFEPQPVEAGLQLPRRLSSMRERNAIPHNTFIICLDTVDSAFSNYAHVRLALEKLFKGEQASDADYALIALGRDVKVIRNLTRDPASILAALNEREFTHAVTESEAPRQAQEETELAGMLSRYCQQCDCTSGHNPSSPDNPCQMQWEAIAEWTAAQAESRRRITRDFLVNLGGLVERLGEVPGRRTVVLVSDGFNMQPGREFYGLMAAFTRSSGALILNTTDNVGPEVEEVVRAAQRRDVSFYTLDSRGVYIVPATGLDINQPVVAPFPGQNTGSRMGVTLANTYSGQQTVASEKQAGLAELASATGGIFFHNSNDFLKGFRQALEDGKSNYLLAYIPTPLIPNGKFHTIKVEVNQRHVVVRAKKGYWAPTAEEGGRPISSLPHTNLRAPAASRSIPNTPPSAGKPRQEQKFPPLSLHNSRPTVHPPVLSQTEAVHTSHASSNSEPVSMTDWSLGELLLSVPQLHGLRAARSQDELSTILGNVGKNVETFARSLTRLSAREEVTEEQLRPNGKVRKKLKEEFEYLVLAREGPEKVDLQEYRTNANGKPAKPVGLTRGFMITSGAFSTALFLLPARQLEFSFRYLGEQILDGRKAYVLVFAQRPESANEGAQLRDREGDRSIAMLLQGIAWIDSGSYKLLSLHTEMRQPRAGVGSERVTTEINYRDVYFQQPAASLWLPNDIIVTATLRDRMWRNQYRYSNFKLFSVESKLRP